MLFHPVWLNEDVFRLGSTIARHHVKRRIVRENLIPYICEECDLRGEWNGKVLVLQLDHRNGINNDNRLENLRFLCPNCHSQQLTYAAKNKTNLDRVAKPYYRGVVATGKTADSKSAEEGSRP
jgi:hypothetical protein